MKVSEVQLTASICRSSLAEFMKTFWHVVAPGEELIWNWHLDLMCYETQLMYERVFKGLPKEYDSVTNVPPGTSKSTVKSVMAPAWAWTRMSHFAFIGASYTADLALELARKNRDVITSSLYQACFPEVKLREDQNTKRYFMTTKGGIRCAVGSLGGATGYHFHVIGIDDPLDPKRAASEAELFHVNQWITGTLFQRKKDARITPVDMVMQRLHQDDPSAWMIQNTNVKHFRIPATTEFEIYPPELAKFYKDGLMDPIRLPKKVLDEKRQPMALGEWGYATQFGQTPVPLSGGAFKTDLLRWGVPPGQYKRVVRFWDHAASKYKRAAFSVGVLMAEDYQERYWVLDVQRGQWDSSEREIKKLECAHRDGHTVRIGQEEEPGSAGKDTTVMSAKKLKGYHLTAIRARGSKEQRAVAFSSQVNAGNVWLPEKFRQGNSWAGWAKAYVDELRHFPDSTFKDQVDSSGGAFGMLCRGRIYVGPLRKKKPVVALGS